MYHIFIMLERHETLDSVTLDIQKCQFWPFRHSQILLSVSGNLSDPCTLQNLGPGGGVPGVKVVGHTRQLISTLLASPPRSGTTPAAETPRALLVQGFT